MPLPRKSKVDAPRPECSESGCRDLLGGAWTPNIVWFLGGGPRRFSELRSDIPAISAKVLSARLRTLEEKGVVNRIVAPSSPPSVEYSLTDLGMELMPAIEAIVNVARGLRRRRPEAARTVAV